LASQPRERDHHRHGFTQGLWPVVTAVGQGRDVGWQQDSTTLAEGEFSEARAVSKPFAFTLITYQGRTLSSRDRPRARHPRDRRLRQLAAADEDELRLVVAADEAEAAGAHLWEVVEDGGVDFHDDRTALEAICSSIPPEMVPTLATKSSTNAAWEAICTMCVGDERVRKSMIQYLRAEYEQIAFRDGELVEDFSLRLSNIVQRLAILGNPEPEAKVVAKYLRVARSRYWQLRCLHRDAPQHRHSADRGHQPAQGSLRETKARQSPGKLWCGSGGGRASAGPG